MSYKKLVPVLAVVLAATVAVGCGLIPTGGEGGVTPEALRRQIVDQHEIEAQQRRQQLLDWQNAQVRLALVGLDEGEQKEIMDCEARNKSDREREEQEAKASLEGEELSHRLAELQSRYKTQLVQATQERKARYQPERERIRSEMDVKFAQARVDLDNQLNIEREEKLADFDRSQQKRLAAERLKREKVEATKQHERKDVRARQAAAARELARTQPFVERKAPIEPVEIHPAPQVEGKGLRTEEDLPLGERRHYVSNYFGRGEALQEIQSSADLKSRLRNRERHELIITFWMEGGADYAVPRFKLNGQLVYSWEELENGIDIFRRRLIQEHCLLYPKVILDQHKDVPRSVVDDVLSICFRVGIRDISPINREPLIEQ